MHLSVIELPRIALCGATQLSDARWGFEATSKDVLEFIVSQTLTTFYLTLELKTVLMRSYYGFCVKRNFLNGF
jgi:hypothetical protein